LPRSCSRSNKPAPPSAPFVLPRPWPPPLHKAGAAASAILLLVSRDRASLPPAPRHAWPSFPCATRAGLSLGGCPRPCAFRSVTWGMWDHPPAGPGIPAGQCLFVQRPIPLQPWPLSRSLAGPPIRGARPAAGRKAKRGGARPRRFPRSRGARDLGGARRWPSRHPRPVTCRRRARGLKEPVPHGQVEPPSSDKGSAVWAGDWRLFGKGGRHRSGSFQN